MDFLGIRQVFWILKLAAWAVLLTSSFRLLLVRKYPLVFAYIFTAIVFDVAMNLSYLIIGPTLVYTYLYIVSSFITIFLAFAVLLRIYDLLLPISLRRDWHLIAAPLLLAFVGIATSEMWFYYRLLNVAYGILTYLAVVTVLRMRSAQNLILGWNLKMVLLALTLPAAFYSLVFSVYTLNLNLSYRDASLWMGGISVAAWIILAVGMTEYSPPIRLPANGEDSKQDQRDSGKNNVDKDGMERVSGTCWHSSPEVSRRSRQLALGTPDQPGLRIQSRLRE